MCPRYLAPEPMHPLSAAQMDWASLNLGGFLLAAGAAL